MKDDFIQKIAHQLFLERSGSLEYKLTEEEVSDLENEKSNDFSIKDGCLIFSSNLIRDEYIAKYFISQIDFSVSDLESVISKTVFEIWTTGLRGDNSIAGFFLSLCEDDINIWNILIDSELNAYEITSIADHFLKYTKEINIKEVISFFSIIYKKFNGYVGIFTCLGERLKDEPEKCYEIINFIHSDIREDTVVLYNFALFSLYNTCSLSVIDILLKDIEKNNSILSSQSLWILGRIVENNDILYRKNEIVASIVKNISSSIAPISDAAIRAAINAIEKISEFGPIILRLLKDNHIKTNEFLSQKISITKTIKTNADFPLWMNNLCTNATTNSSFYSGIMSILASIADDKNQHDLLIDCIFILIKGNVLKEEGNEVEYLAQCITKQGDLTNKLFTLALLDDNPDLAIFAQWFSTHLMVHKSKHILMYSLVVINNFTDDDFIFLVRRMLGFISDENHLMTLTLSLLEVSNPIKRTHNLVKDIILNEIAIDYPYFVIEQIKKYKRETTEKRSNIRKIYNEILKKTESYLENENRLPRIKELEPLSRYTLMFQKERNKVSAKQNDVSQQNSLAFKIATPIPLKAGIASFHHNEYQEGTYSEPSFLHTFSSSYSLPKRYVVDNIGYEMRMLMFRTAKKDNA
ncbi:hypothetical protein [Klebsiella oxytoca]|uniref:hypothetical protein n=1 Tax=Klebsiella oxytoca TaxID=571 RepID=UPI001B98B638|nr:hypothetical protein [Klebsiella oxytoca]EKQ7242186.1 hypothetical protein [Klebsiella oxytoca]WBD78740.1 hypothetical protein OEE41_06650 [Klebsiella oxytoca]HBC8619489.1 hypothetical protein [Klebsiella oxytoca]